MGGAVQSISRNVTRPFDVLLDILQSLMWKNPSASSLLSLFSLCVRCWTTSDTPSLTGAYLKGNFGPVSKEVGFYHSVIDWLSISSKTLMYCQTALRDQPESDRRNPKRSDRRVCEKWSKPQVHSSRWISLVWWRWNAPWSASPPRRKCELCEPVYNNGSIPPRATSRFSSVHENRGNERSHRLSQTHVLHLERETQRDLWRDTGNS